MDNDFKLETPTWSITEKAQWHFLLLRKIWQEDTSTSMGGEKNPPIYVYDTSGAYTDPKIKIDIRNGLPNIRSGWIKNRLDTLELKSPSSDFGKERLKNPNIENMRFNLKRNILKAKPGSNVTQMHYAKKGIITPEMEYVAIRENQNREEYIESLLTEGLKNK